MKRILKQFSLRIAFSIALLSAVVVVKAQEISPYLIGNNAWYDGANLTNLWDDMALAKFQSIRIGGSGAEGYMSNYAKYIGLIDGIRLAKAEPIVQVNHTFTAQQAINLITNLNITNGKKIKLWSISNEPDLPANNFGNAAAVSVYTKRIATALKSVDSTIIIMGPETSWYQNTAYMTPLIGGSADITGKDSLGHYYIDVVTFHKYVFTEISGLESDVTNLLAKLATANAKRPADKQLSWGLTEFNTTYDNAINTLPDQNVWSFHAGQMFAEVYGLGMRKGAFAMNAWSMLEGQTERAGTDLSLFDKDLKGRSNYYHCLMLGQNMKKTYLTTSDNKAGVVVIPMGDTTGLAIMILNKDNAIAYNYTLRLDNAAFVQANALQIKVNVGINIEITGNIAKDATQMLVFDTTGVLVKRYTYTSLDADGRGEPLIEYFTGDAVPVVSLTKPVNDTTIILKSSIMLNAGATDNGTITKVEFTANGALIGKSTIAPYSFTWTPTKAGTYIVAARAYDNLGGVGFSNGATIIVEKVYNYLSIADTIQAEGYDEMFGIQMEATTDIGGGKNIGYCDVNDWLDYTINVPTAGQYLIQVRVASLNLTGAFSLKNGTTTLAAFALPAGTGGWQNWTTLSKSATLSAGNQTIRLLITGKSINVNWIKITSIPLAVAEQYTNKLQLFPNPCKGDYIKINSDQFVTDEFVTVNVSSVSGQKVHSARVQTNKNGSAEIFLSNNKILADGIYFVSVQTREGTFSEKLIVQK